MRGADHSACRLTWQEHAKKCYICEVEFGILTRKHHCRNCGMAVCQNHAKNERIVPQVDETLKHRVCNLCMNPINSEDLIITMCGKTKKQFLQGRSILDRMFDAHAIKSGSGEEAVMKIIHEICVEAMTDALDHSDEKTLRGIVEIFQCPGTSNRISMKFPTMWLAVYHNPNVLYNRDKELLKYLIRILTSSIEFNPLCWQDYNKIYIVNAMLELIGKKDIEYMKAIAEVFLYDNKRTEFKGVLNYKQPPRTTPSSSLSSSSTEESILYSACKCGNGKFVEGVKLLLEWGADPNVIISTSESGVNIKLLDVPGLTPEICALLREKGGTPSITSTNKNNDITSKSANMDGVHATANSIDVNTSCSTTSPSSAVTVTDPLNLPLKLKKVHSNNKDTDSNKNTNTGSGNCSGKSIQKNDNTNATNASIKKSLKAKYKYTDMQMITSALFIIIGIYFFSDIKDFIHSILSILYSFFYDNITSTCSSLMSQTTFTKNILENYQKIAHIIDDTIHKEGIFNTTIIILFLQIFSLIYNNIKNRTTNNQSMSAKPKLDKNGKMILYGKKISIRSYDYNDWATIVSVNKLVLLYIIYTSYHILHAVWKYLFP
jgi:hypothetical protein